MGLRWGIVTAAKICHDFVNAFNSYPNKGDEVIAAVAARNPSKATEFAKMHNIPKVFESYQAMAASKDVGKFKLLFITFIDYPCFRRSLLLLFLETLINFVIDF